MTGRAVESAGAELPLRVVDTPGGLRLVCLCGAEATVIRPGLANELIRLKASHSRPKASAGLTPVGLLRLVLHAKTCVRGQNAAMEATQVIVRVTS